MVFSSAHFDNFVEQLKDFCFANLTVPQKNVTRNLVKNKETCKFVVINN